MSQNLQLIANPNFLPAMYHCNEVAQCGYHTTYETNYKRHISSCEKISQQKIVTKLSKYGNSIGALTEMIDAGILPAQATEYRHRFFIGWDIETLEQKSENEAIFDQSHMEFWETGGGLEYIAKCKVASICIGSNLPGIEPKTLVRNDSTPESAVELIERFFRELENIHEQIVATVPSYIFDAKEHVESVIEEGGFSKFSSTHYKWLRYLESFTNTSCFGFNSSKFDLPCIAPLLFSVANRCDYEISCIKRGARYLNVTIGQLSFRDVLMLSSPCKLTDYLKMWKATECKSVFPYQKYSSIEDLGNDTEFPPFDDFFSSLSNCNISPELYNSSKELFYKLKNLPDSDPNKINSMLGWLKYYNAQDVGPMCQAIENQFDAFYTLFGQDLVTFFSLPSVAQKICYDNFDQNSPLVCSFHEEEYRQDFRNNIVGGLTNVMHRMVNTRDETGPYNSRHAPDGNLFTHFQFLDFNSLYLWVS